MEAIVVALIAALAAVFPALWMRRTSKASAKTQAIVQGNGHGDVSHMLETLLKQGDANALALAATAQQFADHTVADAVNFEHLRQLLTDRN